MKMNHELTAKWHELDKVRVGLKDVVVFRPDLRVADGYIQYSTDSGSTWQNLIAVAELKGADGSKGDPGIAGQDGHSPVVTATKSGKTTTISVDGADIATVEDGVDGKPGAAGADGVTPHIGDNGHWYLGGTDTGKPSRGATGPQGAPGKDGAGMDITGATVGQIAKIAAVDASGVPTAWSPADMPSGGSSDFVITGTVTGETLTTDKTYEQVQEAVQAGKRVTLKVNVYGIDFVLSQIGENSSGYLFATAATIVPGLIAQFTAAVGESGQNLFVNAKVVSYDSDGNLMQATMDSDPSQPMEIATKQYVDASGVPSVTVADNGKFMRVVNGAWSAEDMPTGGTDMGITGASVGQIAKITAVDESGVPTAWSPVDMPTTLPNPNALTFTGAVTGTYDGSAPVTVNIPEGGGGTGGGYSDYEVLIDETITTDAAGISTISYTELDFSQYNDIVIFFDRAMNKANSNKVLKVSINMLGYLTVYNHSIANPTDSYRSSIFRVLNMGNGNVASFSCTANNQNNNPDRLNCCGIFPLNDRYVASRDNGFYLQLSEAYIGEIKIKILAK